MKITNSRRYTIKVQKPAHTQLLPQTEKNTSSSLTLKRVRNYIL